ncbi:hypothetical protein RhiirA4_483565 [Rhizophagus irregularis]|uniref:Uncharacterized protein n=1 Tax=Rhizophagus irregularis TaxID=588596 RepID=A0A2I1HMT8_9GLOM|nr:hypothetical protein RhiirA4_483565 [Rhizophagus irregularis]
MTQSELLEFFNVPALYKQGFKAKDVSECLYKIRDDSVRPRHFFSADNKDEIKAIVKAISYMNILMDKKLCLLPIVVIRKKISLHILTFGIRLLNIAQVTMFTKLIHKKLPVGLQDKGDPFDPKVLRSLQYKKEMKEHIRIKKAVHLKNRTIFDFMIRLPNNESEVVKSSLLDILELKVKIYDDINSKTDQVKFELIEELREKTSIEGFNFSYSSESFSNVFFLKHILFGQK